MKDLIKFLGIIVLITAAAIPAAAFGTSNRSSPSVTASSAPQLGLTITGLSDYNGLFIQAEANDGAIEAGSHIIQGDHPMTGDPSMLLAGGVIKDGAVTLNVWNVETILTYYDEFTGQHYDYERTPYTGSDELTFYISIWADGRIPEVYHWHYVEEYGIVKVKFNNGAAQGVFVLSGM